MKSSIKWVAGIAGLLLTVVVVGAWLTIRALEPTCGSSPIAEIPAPNGRLKAVVFEHDCGATTDFATHVAVLSATDVLDNKPGNVLVVDADHGSAPRGPGGGPEVRVSWGADTLLRVAYHKRARVFLSQNRVRGVAVAYTTFER